MRPIRILLAVLPLLLAVPPLEAQQRGVAAEPKPFALTVDHIMRGPDLVGYPPSGLRWAGDSRTLYFEWRLPGEEEGSTYALDRGATTPRKLSEGERKLAPPVSGAWDQARRRVLFTERGDIVLIDTIAGTRRQITRTTAPESSPEWAKNEMAITYVSQNNLFLVPLDSGQVQQLTDVHPRRREPRENDSQKFVKDQESALIEFTRQAAVRRRKDEEERKKNALPELEISERQSVASISLHPSGTWAFLLVVDRADGTKTASVPNYVTESGYTEELTSRVKVGDAQERRRLAILNLQTGKSVWADGGFAGTKPPRPAQPAAATSPSGEEASSQRAAVRKDEPREVRWGMPLVSPDGSIAVVATRSEDFKDRWIVTLDPETGKTRVIDHLHDDAWVREVGGGRFGGSGLDWMPDGHTVWFLSERDGWMHLWTLDAADPAATSVQMTRGAYELSAVSLSPDKTKFVFVSNQVHPGERHIYEMPVGGGPPIRLTTATGSSTGDVSPDGQLIALIHSSASRPPEVFVMPYEAGAPMQQVTMTPTEEWRSYRWIEPQVVTFKARDGADVYARLFTPEMVGARRDRSRPGVVFVHGAGYAQNAHKYWASYYREYMFDHLLASRGYVVLDVDYRASAGYGRHWRTAVYRHMGGKDLDDIVDGAAYLVREQRVDPKRIGVYGGSYGGFITLMAMFTSPRTFAAGAALRPVTDWAHYNHPYTAAILNQPQDDPEAYKRSSPIYFAEGLTGALLICHGLVDTNVHAQDSIRLAQRLIELRKTNWELALYPVENHSFTQETSWADEYRRILELFERNLRLARR
ncbi:MAG: prolyl oligopeptidase family serine peptidase [Acidobacteriota bacterium]